MLCIIFIAFVSYANSKDDNATVVAYDNATTASFDNYTNSQSKEESYYGRYPVDVVKDLYIIKDVNKQLKGSGLIFLPNSPGDVFPADDVDNNEGEQYQQNNNDMGIIEVKVKKGGK